MEIQIKMQKSETEVEDKRKFIDVNSKDYFENFSKKWEIATSRLKPLVGKLTPEQKKQKQNFKRTSHSFVYLGGTRKNGRSTEVCSNGKELS